MLINIIGKTYYPVWKQILKDTRRNYFILRTPKNFVLGKVECLKQYIILSTLVIVNDKKWNIKKRVIEKMRFTECYSNAFKRCLQMKFLFLYFWYIFSISYFKTDELYYKYYERCYEYYEYYERYYKILRVVLRDTKRLYKWYYETLRGTTSGTMSHYEILRVVLQDTARYYGWYYESLCGTKRHFERFSITRRVVPRDVTI